MSTAASHTGAAVEGKVEDMENDLWLWNTRRDGIIYDSRGRMIDGYGYREGSSRDKYTAKLIARGYLAVVPGGIPGQSGAGSESADTPEPDNTTEED